MLVIDRRNLPAARPRCIPRGVHAFPPPRRTPVMKRLIPLIGMASALALVAGCADTGYGDKYGYRHSDGAYGADYGPPAVGFEAFYDDSYGPFFDGYWANDGFYYRSSNQEAYHRDTGGPFRRE